MIAPKFDVVCDGGTSNLDLQILSARTAKPSVTGNLFLQNALSEKSPLNREH